MNPMQLDACPICRAALDGAPVTCPSCSSDLSVYRDLATRADELVAAAREQLARGDDTLAREVVARLPQLVADPGSGYHSLAARLAISAGRDAEAREHLKHLPGDEAAALSSAVESIASLTQTAREEYNFALTAARAGRHEIALRHARRACELEPADARMLRLRLKLNVKLAQWQAVYRDLAALDALAARPEWAVGLEAQLPPLASLAA
jgi:hypothetical protein